MSEAFSVTTSSRFSSSRVDLTQELDEDRELDGARLREHDPTVDRDTVTGRGVEDGHSEDTVDAGGDVEHVLLEALP